MTAFSDSKLILVVTNNSKTVKWLGFCLDRDAYRINQVPADDVLVSSLAAHKADLIIIDDSFPTLCSRQFLGAIRAVSLVPVIVLVNRQVFREPLEFLELGADDYVCIPFNFQELAARVRALCRRCGWGALDISEQASRYRVFGGYVLDTCLQTLRDRNGHEIDISGTDYRLLQMLIDSAGNVLGREAIASITGGRNCSPLDRFIDVQISRLRKRLGDSAGAQSLIRTVRGRGYLLAVDVQATDRPLWF